MGIPVMASLNSALGAKLGHPAGASIILFVVAFVCTLIFTVANKVDLNLSFDKLPFYYYLGGFFVAFYVLSITWSAPILGVSTAIFLVLLGQIGASMIIEHFSLFNTKGEATTPLQLVGVGLMVVGIILARKNP